jgi:hypothetical protein
MELQQALRKEGVNDFIAGAIQYNWRNYYKVSVGEKQDIDRFDVEQFSVLSPLNYAGHKFYKHAIDLLHASGEEYIKYLNSKNYRMNEHCDLQGAIHRGVWCARNSGLELAEGYVVPERQTCIGGEVLDRYKNGPKQISDPIAELIIKRMIENAEQIGKTQEQEYQSDYDEER